MFSAYFLPLCGANSKTQKVKLGAETEGGPLTTSSRRVLSDQKNERNAFQNPPSPKNF